MLVCLEEWLCFYYVVIWLIIPTNRAFSCRFYHLQIRVYYIFKTRPPYFKTTIIVVLIHTKMRSCDNIRFNILWLHIECMGEETVSDSDSNYSVLNIGTELIIRFGLVLKIGIVFPVTIIGVGMASRFCFPVFKYGSSCRWSCVRLL